MQRTAAQLIRVGAIGTMMLSVAGAFAYAGGWLSPVRLTQDRMMAAFQDAYGTHVGFRRNHAKGVCVTGWFDSSGQATALSKAAVFRPGRVAVVGRFALAGGMPFQTDAPATVRSMALRFLLPGGEEWRTGMNNIPVFPVNSARGFYEQLLASSPDPATGKSDPARMKAFLAAHPETVRALSLIKKREVTSGFANSTFNSLNAFRFVDTAGASVPVRWSVVPVQPSAVESAEPSAAGDKNYLFDDLIAHPDIDLVAVVVRVPRHQALVVRALEAGEGRVLRMAARRDTRGGRDHGESGKRAAVAHGGRIASAERPNDDVRA